MERDFRPSLTSKYLVGKVLGEGTTSLVRLGYRRDDFKKFAQKMINTRSLPSKYSAEAIPTVPSTTPSNLH